MPNFLASFAATSSTASRAFFGGIVWAWRMSMWDMRRFRGAWRSILLDFLRVDALRLRFPGQDQPDLVLGTGVLGIGRGMDGALAPVSPLDEALVQLCVDRRGVWLKLDPRARTVHVNGRPVRRMAMLRVGDAIYVEGGEMLLLGAQDAESRVPAPVAQGAEDADPRVILRGVGGQYHGRSFTLDRPRVVGRGADCDIRIDDPAFAERHARFELQGADVVLRDLSGEGSVVNGEPVRHAVLHTGDQVVFDSHQRFVVEAPGRPARTRGHDDHPGVEHLDAAPGMAHAAALPQNGRRLPWLLLAALLLAAGLSALLLFGSSP